MGLPETRYARSGELNIAYQVLGDGPFDLVFVPGFISHLDLQWVDPLAHPFFERLASFSRLILFDKRGTGLSDPVAGPAPLEERMDDLRAVMDAAGSERAAIIGVSEGGPLAILFAASYPERVSSLALCGTFVVGPESEAADTEADVFKELGGERWTRDGDLIEQIMLHEWGSGKTLAMLAPSLEGGRMASLSLAAFERSAVSPRMVQAIYDMAAEVDVRDILPTIAVPTLVVHREHEIFPVEQARYMAARIPDARLAVLPGVDHVPWVGDGEAYLDELQEFLTGAFAEQAPGRVLSTVLFTDIVSSTERASEPEQWAVYRVLGDDERDGAARLPVEDERRTRMMDRALLATLRRNPRMTRRFLERTGWQPTVSPSRPPAPVDQSAS